MNSKLQIHQNIIDKLQYFYEIHKIPNILFHGDSGCGKRTVVDNFIDTIYKGDKEMIKTMTMYVNCAHGKGIKFIREDLKYFAKTHINANGGNLFKSINKLDDINLHKMPDNFYDEYFIISPNDTETKNYHSTFDMY
jgi:DNA polymerase III delta prime subunit